MVSGQLWTFPRRFLGVFTLVAAESRESGIVTTRYVYSTQEPAEQVLVLGINPPLVSHLFCQCLRSVVDIPTQNFSPLAFLAVESRDDGLGTGRYVPLTLQ